VIGDGDKQHISITVAWLSEVLGDLHHLQSNTTRALRIFESSGLPYAVFGECIRAAYSQTLRQMPRLRCPMAYFFTNLGDQCQRFTHGLTAAEASRLCQAPGGPGAGSKGAGL